MPPVVFLMPVWGEHHITQFLNLGLRTLLAPGNIPAVAAACDCTFRILTTAGQQAHFRAHPLFEHLQRYCTIDFTGIDDLIAPRMHSLTITEAYVRGMRTSGDAMTRTYFVFLVADYVMADGSIGHLLRHIRAGVSGITTGNFQIVKETAEPVIRALIPDSSAPLCLAPRTLLTIAFEHLHPAVLASMADAAPHTMICNRVYWRADPETLVARFYLRHMLCIRPETDRFEIGSSCDYSFIPELCPSGRVVPVTDSDDYCVIEMQPKHHEHEFVAPGRLTPRRLAGYLRDWTTADHRRNALSPVVFHTGDIAPTVAAVVARSDAYVRKVAKHLTAPPMPHRGHHYWRSALSARAAWCDRERRFGARAPFTRFHSSDVTAGERVRSVLTLARWAYDRLLSTNLLPCLPSWLDNRSTSRVMRRALREPAGLVIAAVATESTNLAARRAGPSWRFLSPSALDAGLDEGGPFSVCLLDLDASELSSLADMLRRIRPRLTADARAIVIVRGDRSPVLRSAVVQAVAEFRIDSMEVTRSLSPSLIGRVSHRTMRRTLIAPPHHVSAVHLLRLAGLAIAAIPLNLVRLIRPPGAAPVTTLIATVSDPARTRRPLERAT